MNEYQCDKCEYEIQDNESLETLDGHEQLCEWCYLKESQS